MKRIPETLEGLFSCDSVETCFLIVHFAGLQMLLYHRMVQVNDRL